MAERKKPWRFGLQGHLGMLLAVFMVLTGLTLALIGYHLVSTASDAVVQEKVEDLTNIIENEIVHGVRQPVLPTLDALSQGVLPECHTLEERLFRLPLLATLLSNYTIISGFMVGYENGEFFMIRRLVAEEEQEAYRAPPSSAFLVSSVTRNAGTVLHEHLFYDDQLRLILRQPAGWEQPFDPRARPWFQAAMRSDGQVELSTFLSLSRLPVMIFAQKSRNGQAVVGVDVTLRQLSETLRKELPTPNSRLALLKPDGTLLASSNGMIAGNEGDARLRTVDDIAPILRLATRAYLDGQRGRGIKINDGEQNWEVSLEEFTFNGMIKDVMALAIPRDDLLSGGMTFLRYAVVAVVGVIFLCIPLIVLLSKRISRPLNSLAEQAGNLREFVLNEKNTVKSGISEIQALAGSMRHLQGSIRRMLTITQAINSERDFGALLQRVLEETLSLVKADGGLVGLLDEKKKIVLDQGSVYWNANGKKVARPSVADLREPDMTPASYQALAQDAVVVTSITRADRRSSMAHIAPGFADPAVVRVDAVCVPLHDRMGEHIGVLVVCKAIKPGASGFAIEEVSFIESFAATAGIALENQRLIKAQTDLRDALIHILAGAIDAKSPYTGGHCQRVPVIFQMLL